MNELVEKSQDVLTQEIIIKEKLSDTTIAGSMKLSQQAVNQIRSKLENLGVIKGYSPIIDFEKIGITVIILIGIRLTHKVWENKKEWEIEQNLKKIPFIFEAYRIAGQDISHVLCMGFKDDIQKDKFIKKLQTIYEDQLNLKWSYSFSAKDIILQDQLGLLYQIIDKKDFEFEKLFL